MGIIFSTNTSTDVDKNTTRIKQPPKNTPLYETLDYIATHYILTMDFQSLQKLHEKEYCESLIILTSSIIDRHFTTLDIEKMSKRIDTGINHDSERKTMTFFEKDILDDGSTPDFKKKQHMCNKIAKFYVKIAHLFSAIVQTINPMYTYTDFYGNEVKVPLSEKDKIPEDTKITVEKLNLCSNRSTILSEKGKELNGKELNGTDAKNNERDICSIHLSGAEKGTTLNNEPGIPELMDLYYDADYNYKDGKFNGMKPETTTQFMKDLTLFYREFTGNTGELPSSITKFSDIKLHDYCKKKKSSSDLSTSYNKEHLLTDYATNLNLMIQSVNNSHQQLLQIVNMIFVYINEDEKEQKEEQEQGTILRINPALTEEKLQSIIENARNIIVSLYLKCEHDFVNGLHLYEAIVDTQILTTTQRQLESLEETKQSLYDDSFP